MKGKNGMDIKWEIAFYLIEAKKAVDSLSFSCSEKPDFVMIVYSANNDSRHRRKIYIYKDIIEPLIMSVEFLNKEIKKQNHGTVTPDT